MRSTRVRLVIALAAVLLCSCGGGALPMSDPPVATDPTGFSCPPMHGLCEGDVLLGCSLLGIDAYPIMDCTTQGLVCASSGCSRENAKTAWLPPACCVAPASAPTPQDP